MTAMPAIPRVGRAVEDDALPVEEHLAAVRPVHSGEGLDQGRLACAVLTRERVRLAGEQLQGDVLQGPYGTEGLAHALQGQDRGRVRGGLVHGSSSAVAWSLHAP